ncbi:MAG: electron transport complex subunit E [Oscillospiraceae bacterium]|jgi:electron transport complex protein RnfE|nr:electron transport complex subunit E [Oscillospiraceae bacterium]
MGRLSELTKGIIRENPVLVLVLGTCPTLAVSTQTGSAVGMGIAATAVLLGSNVAISLLRGVIPDKVRIPCFIVLIAGFVTVVQMVVEAYSYTLFQALGIYLPLIVVNCIILGRAEMFASKNGVAASALDAIGMGLGFTLTLFVMATIRETLGNGTWMGLEIPGLSGNGVAVLTMAPGGFIVFGCMIALVNKITKARGGEVRAEVDGCAGCPSAEACGKN